MQTTNKYYVESTPNLITCKCGSTNWELERSFQFANFWEKEYDKEKGFTEREPGFISKTVKLKCVSCSKYLGEE